MGKSMSYDSEKSRLFNAILAAVVLSSVFVLALSSTAHAAVENSIIKRLEAGEVVSAKSGSSFIIQALVDKDPMKVQQVLMSDLSKLPDVFENVAFARTYKDKAGKKLLYLKLRGLGDGLGILMEVKQGADQAFRNAKDFNSSGAYQYRNTLQDVNLATDPNAQELTKEVAATNKANSAEMRTLVNGPSLVLEGPLNEIMELPNLRVTLNLSVGTYMVMKKGQLPVIKSYLVSKTAFGSQTPKESLGDYRGFGDARLGLAERMAKDLFAVLQLKLASLL
jgi:hypothetical protein